MLLRRACVVSSVLLAAAVLCGCGDGDQKKQTGLRKSFRAALVFDVGGRGDKSFNDAAYDGFMAAARLLNAEPEEFKYLEPSGAIDRDAALRGYAEQGFDVVIGVGFLFTEAIYRIAPQFPKTWFVCVDYDAYGKPQVPANVIGLTYREEEGSYLVGAIAALTTKTDKIGFIGGMQTPLIEKFEAGYCAGAKGANPNVEVFVSYAGQTPDAFADPVRGKELARTQFQRGADIIYHASGSTGLGVFEAAIEAGKLAIGVDKDQYADAPGHILTSMFKRVDSSVRDTIVKAANGSIRGGLEQYGLADNAVGYVYDDNNKSLIPEAVRERAEGLRARIVSGELKVPTKAK
ncbi:MAG: BMP family ABC transporter substrate-binding protein [Planctomycetota bacterium]|nr:BMP family ABC transporter substrate-binding protein [Planctomycetota bacterium]